jgi:hypothetical protein
VAVTRGIAPVDRAARIRYTEWNIQLPSAVAPVHSAAEITYLEQNTMLPTGSVAVARSLEQIRFLEMNRLPGDDLFAPEVIRGARS